MKLEFTEDMTAHERRVMEDNQEFFEYCVCSLSRYLISRAFEDWKTTNRSDSQYPDTMSLTFSFEEGWRVHCDDYGFIISDTEEQSKKIIDSGGECLGRIADFFPATAVDDFTDEQYRYKEVFTVTEGDPHRQGPTCQLDKDEIDEIQEQISTECAVVYAYNAAHALKIAEQYDRGVADYDNLHIHHLGESIKIVEDCLRELDTFEFIG